MSRSFQCRHYEVRANRHRVGDTETSSGINGLAVAPILTYARARVKAWIWGCSMLRWLRWRERRRLVTVDKPKPAHFLAIERGHYDKLDDQENGAGK
jgi:hypothetical protein